MKTKHQATGEESAEPVAAWRLALLALVMVAGIYRMMPNDSDLTVFMDRDLTG